ncbi:ABC transporter ATP-binding protein [Methylocapsa palsarum]|uniref:Osmoprotectant transport system ATP-binding protein n=1 Tax=Methylocapsa palsarum TaxID=1612308 RepID=A0A1I3YMC5_9HYPH|nr:ABC transporter ATP-binding protein [Methylocapsa palsarum]SFK32923.1 osmoprotectant transport system ATP-binding protein [Methylocapsa palsarum]
MIELRGVSKAFGAAPAVVDLSLSIGRGAFFVLIGPSGCGKSTVLRMINAMIACDRGAIELRGEDIRAMDPVRLRRGIGYVIQSVGLFPHWTIEKNIGAVPRLLGWSRETLAARVEEIAALLQIDRELLRRYPHQLSGGQQQRAGVARALAADPDIVLMDEPFAALDPVSRASLQDEMRRLHAETGKTFVFVTHDMDEALRLATHIAVMKDGRLVQTAAPRDLLNRPEDEFVREFFGREAMGLRLLDFVAVRDRMRGRPRAPETIGADASLRDALALMIERRCSRLSVTDGGGGKISEIDIADIIKGQDAT